MSITALVLERKPSTAKYRVGERVYFTITINLTAGLHLGDVVTGTVINVLEACGWCFYRLELDTEPKKSIVGNVLAYELKPIS